MSLKDALSADLSARKMNLGALADRMGISQQSISKWIARDEIPQSRHEEVREILGAESATVKYLGQQLIRELEALQAAPMFSRAEAPPEVPSYSRRAPQEPHTFRHYTTPLPGQINSESMAGIFPLPLSFPLRDQIDPQLQKYVDQRAMVNGLNRRFDYFSDTLALRVTRNPLGAMPPGMPTVLALLLAAAVFDEKRCVLAHVPDPNRPARLAYEPDIQRAARFRSDMRALGVEVVEFPNYEALAAQIEAWEITPLKEWHGLDEDD